MKKRSNKHFQVQQRNGQETHDSYPQQDNDDNSVERLPSANNRARVSRNSKLLKSKSLLSKNDESGDDDQSSKMPLPKRKIKIIQNSKNTKEPRIKNSHMVILKSIKQKLNIQGMLKDK